jgi:hypothetical protein
MIAAVQCIDFIDNSRMGCSIRCTNGFGLALAKVRENSEAVRVIFWPLFVLD